MLRVMHATTKGDIKEPKEELFHLQEEFREEELGMCIVGKLDSLPCSIITGISSTYTFLTAYN